MTRDEIRQKIATDDEWNHLRRLGEEYRSLSAVPYASLDFVTRREQQVLLEAARMAEETFAQSLCARYASRQTYTGAPLAGLPSEPSLKLLSDPNDGGSVG